MISLTLFPRWRSWKRSASEVTIFGPRAAVCVFTKRSVVKMQGLRNGVKSLRSHVSTPCWAETSVAEPALSEVERDESGQPMALVIAWFLLIFRAGCPEKSFAKITPPPSRCFSNHKNLNMEELNTFCKAMSTEYFTSLLDYSVVPTNQCRLFFINELPE